MARELLKLCKELNITLKAETAARPPSNTWPAGANHYAVTLKFQGREMHTEYHAGSGIKDAPTPAAVLACLVSDADSVRDRSFEDFCSDMDLQTDSRKALEMYLACQRTDSDLRKFLGLHRETIEAAARDY